jgi:outer membrane biosynthesis protein TonB
MAMLSRGSVFPLDAGPTRVLVRVVLVAGLAVAAWLLTLALSSPALASTNTGDTGQQESDSTATAPAQEDEDSAPAEQPAEEQPEEGPSEPAEPSEPPEPAEPGEDSEPTDDTEQPAEQPEPAEDTEQAEQPADPEPADPKQPAKDTADSTDPKDSDSGRPVSPDQPDPMTEAPAEQDADAPAGEQLEHRDRTAILMIDKTMATTMSTEAVSQDAGLLGLVNGTVNGLADTIRGTVDSMLHSAESTLSPITGGCDYVVLPLPDFHGLLPDLGDGRWPFPSHPESGDDEAGSLPPPDEPVEPAEPPRPATAPAPAPEQSARTASGPQDRQSTVQPQGQAVTVELQEPIGTADTADTPGTADTSASNGSGSGSGSGPLAPAPTGPVGSTGHVHAGSDNSAGGRQPLAVLGSAANTTQLRLMGTSRDPAAEGAGRDAALPTTSPD